MLTPIKFDNYCRDNLALVEQFVNEYADEKMEWKICANMVANGKAQRETMADLIGKVDFETGRNYLMILASEGKLMEVNGKYRKVE